MSKQKPEVGDHFTMKDGAERVVTAVGGKKFLYRHTDRTNEYIADLDSWMGYQWIDPDQSCGVADWWGFLNKNGRFISCANEREAREICSSTDARLTGRTLARIIGGVVHVEDQPIGKPAYADWVPAPVKT